MLVFPHSHLFIGGHLTVVTSGPHIQVVDTLTGDVRYSTHLDHSRDAAVKSGPIRCAALDKDGKHLLTCGDDKFLKLWEVEGLKLVNQRELPKRPTAVRFTTDGQSILAADKFGDVFSYPFHYTLRSAEEEEARGKGQNSRDPLASHENPSNGRLILGHVSVLLAFLLTPDEKYIITADRDEHIRVSWFPQGYNIETYCLGHTKFVSAIHIPSFAPEELISGGGDPVLKVWEWKTGELKCEVRVWEAVEPFVVVRGGKRRRSEDEGGARKGKGRKSKGRVKGKVKQDRPNAGDGPEVANEDEGMEEQDTAGWNPPEDDKAERILAVRRIESLALGPRRHVIFSAVGATALFTHVYPERGLWSSVSDVSAFSLGSPVIDFFISENGLIWVLLDGNFSQDSGTPDNVNNGMKFVRVLHLSSGKLSEVALESLHFKALNSKCLLEATPEDIKQLSLYNDLLSIPKSSDEQEHEESGGLPMEDDNPTSKRIQGRMKNKRAVQERLQKVNASEKGLNIVQARREDEDEREPKRSRSSHEGSESGEKPGDVVMIDK